MERKRKRNWSFETWHKRSYVEKKKKKLAVDDFFFGFVNGTIIGLPIHGQFNQKLIFIFLVSLIPAFPSLFTWRKNILYSFVLICTFTIIFYFYWIEVWPMMGHRRFDLTNTCGRQQGLTGWEWPKIEADCERKSFHFVSQLSKYSTH